MLFPVVGLSGLTTETQSSVCVLKSVKRTAKRVCVRAVDNEFATQ